VAEWSLADLMGMKIVLAEINGLHLPRWRSS